MIDSVLCIVDLAEACIAERNLSAGYVDNFRRAVRSLKSHAGHVVTICDLTPELVNSFLTALGPGRSPATVLQYRNIILSLWGWASDCGYCEPPVCRRIKRPKVVSPIPIAWTAAEVQRLIAACDSPWWNSLARTAYDTGLRRGDLLSLTADNLRDGVITLRPSKTPNKIVARRIHPSTLAAIKVIETTKFSPRANSDLLWPWHQGREKWFSDFRKIVAAADLVGTFKFLRRTSGTLVEAENPGAGQNHLAHSSRAVFERYYLDDGMVAGSSPMPPELR